MIEQVDEQFGRLLAALDQTGQRDNTIVIFMSDHGEALGDHGLTHKGCRFFDGLTRVPLIMALPGRFVDGLRSDALVELTDIAPTLLELAGLSIPDGTQGRSLLPILTGRASPDHHRDYVRCEYYDAVNLPDRSFGTMYRDDRWKLIQYPQINHTQLFDLKSDPHELHDLAGQPRYAGKTKSLLKRMEKAQREWGDDCPLTSANPAPAEWSPDQVKLTPAEAKAMADQLKK